jgi:ATP-dependent helicase/DNAse subunit B
VATRAAVERSRQEFFARADGPGDRYSGRIDHDPALVERLRLREYAGPRKPLAVTTLERAARCGYKAFALEVLRIEERADEAETLDDKSRGHLLHKLLESGQEALQATRALAPTERWMAVRAALDDAGAEFAVHESRLNASLLEADLRAIRRQVELWLERRMNDPAGWQMIETEVAFGPRKKWPALEVSMGDGEPVVIQGRIDGVERSGAALRVVEFKSGRGDGFRKRLQEGALDTQFQMVVYAAALERARRAGALDGDPAAVDGIYVGFRDLTEHGLRDALTRPRKRGPVFDIDDLVGRGSEGEGPLGEAVRRVILPLRAGHFEPRPRDCDFCQYRSLCRVETHDGLLDEHGEPQ